MRPFDIEAARRGEPIQAHYDGEWVDAELVGIHGGLAIVFVARASAQYSQWRERLLRMAPRKRIVYVNLYKRGANHECAYHDTEELAIEMTSGTGDWLIARAVPVEIEE